MIWKRIGIMAATLGVAIVGVWLFIALLFFLHGSPAMQFLETLCGSPAKAERAVEFVLFGGGLLGLAILCGYLQPVTDTPWMSGFLWCPFTWLGLIDLRNLEKRPLLTITVVGIAWFACGLGMKLKAMTEERKFRENESAAPS